MNCTRTEAKLIKAMAQMAIVDAHEHLPPEHERTSSKVDVLTLFAHYCRTDLCTAGLSADDYQRVIDAEGPLDERWELFKPYLAHIWYGSYARPAFIAAREFYGCDDINDQTYHTISERMMEQNNPGIYRRILCEKCKIVAALTQAQRTDYTESFLLPLMPVDSYAGVGSAEDIALRGSELGVDVKGIDDYVELVRLGLRKWVDERVVGLKMRSSPIGRPRRDLAEGLLRKIITQNKTAKDLGGARELREFLVHRILELAAEMGLVVAVHSGVWGDFRDLDAKHMIPVFSQHPDTRFDLYHLSMPSVRDAIMIGKNNPNVWLNLCWCHIVSPAMTVSALDECIDLVPMNKIIGFGGDYRIPVEKVYGHLLMARENIAIVLGQRVDRGLMSVDEAAAIAHRWLYMNPKELYRLAV